uniref:Uncharacterized protein n=1 Tax=Glossina austeni TaxID=7395 RepID=A0A1A9UM89_GLOAU
MPTSAVILKFKADVNLKETARWRQTFQYMRFNGKNMQLPLKKATNTVSMTGNSEKRTFVSNAKAAENTETQTDEKIPNKGRVNCVTSARDNHSMKSLEDIFDNVLIIAANNDTKATIKLRSLAHRSLDH